MRQLYPVFLILTIVGGVNWGLVGLFSFDLVATLFGTTILAKIVYVLIGVSAIYMLYDTIQHKDKLLTGVPS